MVRTDAGAQAPTERTHPVPGTRWAVRWSHPWECYVISGPGAPDVGQALESVQALARALAPVALPEPLRVALAVDRAVRPPYVHDRWRRRVQLITALLEPLGEGMIEAAPYIAAPALEAVQVWLDSDLDGAEPWARQILTQAGYRMERAGPDPGTEGLYLVYSTGRIRP